MSFNAVPDLDPVVLAGLRRHLTRGPDGGVPDLTALLPEEARVRPDGVRGAIEADVVGAGHTEIPVLVQPDDGHFSYFYEVEGYTTAGLPRPGVSGSTSDLTLFVPLPQ
jgi:hypothetical protein